MAMALGLACLATPGRADPTTPVCPAPTLRDGETLHYRATAWKGFVSSTIGDASLRVEQTRDAAGTPGWRIVARAKGSTMGQTMDAEVITTLGPIGRRTLEYAETNRGSHRSGRRLEFGTEALVYRKLKHCPGCHDRAHFDGDAHCDDGHCGIFEHRIWRVRHRHAPDPLVIDPLTALYRARTLDLRVGAPTQTLRVWCGHGIFDVAVRVAAKERCTVAAGTFDALRLELTPTPAPGIPNTVRFQGLFGLTGSITVHVDAATRIPLRVTGVVPMGVDVNVQVELTKVDAGAAPTGFPPLAAHGR